MIKKTLYFGSPAYLSCKQDQLIINLKPEQLEMNFVDYEDYEKRYENRKNLNKTIPIEDIGVIIIDHYGVTISQYLLNALLENNSAIVICNKTHHPTGLFLNLDSNSTQSEKFRAQIESSMPLKKQLWQQTVKAKILNQAGLLSSAGRETGNMISWASEVKSGDTGGHEARAAAYYWKAIFSENIDFYRSRSGPPPNNLLNYSYAILRAVTARALAGSGLLPTLGIFHRNKYNAYCLADDIMEPYRPFADKIVCELTDYGIREEELNKQIKQRLLELPAADVIIDKEKSPLMVAMQRTTSSVAKCFEGKVKNILYPVMES
ncbi:MAG: type II CRISPR-associated endonuclease Cas1 [Ignavibacteria bacterium]|nr:type II CRISPR-associated endonuclease Cas1 [Ignavibacteria bacterium]